MQERMESSQLRTFNLTASDLVKDHLRYLVIYALFTSFCLFSYFARVIIFVQLMMQMEVSSFF